MGIDPGPAEAWIGTSEFADAASITAASAFGDHALTSFTLMKVVGRDMFIGVWSFLLAFISITLWEKRKDGPKAGAQQIFHARLAKAGISYTLPPTLQPGTAADKRDSFLQLLPRPRSTSGLIRFSKRDTARTCFYFRPFNIKRSLANNHQKKSSTGLPK